MTNIGQEALPLFDQESLALDTNHKNYTTIQTFFILFSDVRNFLSDNIPSAIELVNPRWVAEQCPELRITYDLNNTWVGWNESDDELRKRITRITLRNPTLILMQLLGILVGLSGALRLFLLRAKLPSNNSTKKRLASIIHTEQWTQILYWPAAFFWFAMMNTTSIFAHSIFEPYTPSYRLWLKFDVMCTCLSSLNLALASICALWPGACGILSERHVSLAINICLVSAVIKVGLNSWPWQAETLYLLSLIIASILMAILFLRRLRQKTVRCQEKILMISAACSVGIFPAGAFMDIGSCLLFGDSRLSSMPVAFFGCDISFFFIVWWIQTVRSTAVCDY